MSADDKIDDAAARKARAEAIRRARDARNASLNEPSGEKPAAGPDSPTPTDGSGNASSTSEESPPNYLDWIDRKMREGERNKKPGGQKND